MPLVTREEWGARPRESGTTSITDEPSITVHWEGAGWVWPWAHDTCDNKVRGIQAYHMDHRDWSDIAYNYLNCPHGYTFEGRGFDRRSSANGNDASNFASFATQAMWGSNAGAPVPNALKDALLFSFDILRRQGNATDEVLGHRDWHSTDCPGDELYAWVKAGCPDPTPAVVYEDEKVNNGAMLSQEAMNQIDAWFVNKCKGPNGQLYKVVQMFSAFNAKHDDQLVDDTGAYAGKVTDILLKDDFKAIADAVAAVKESNNELENKIDAILQKLNSPTS